MVHLLSPWRSACFGVIDKLITLICVVYTSGCTWLGLLSSTSALHDFCVLEHVLYVQRLVRLSFGMFSVAVYRDILPASATIFISHFVFGDLAFLIFPSECDVYYSCS